jgi:hypothetical protein
MEVIELNDADSRATFMIEWQVITRYWSVSEYAVAAYWQEHTSQQAG